VDIEKAVEIINSRELLKVVRGQIKEAYSEFDDLFEKY
jgi:hypothetical protein